MNGEVVLTGRRKFVVCGDGVKTGIQMGLNAGVKVESGEWTRLGETVVQG